MRQRCMELLDQSAKTSADKLKFFRLAFGAAGGFGESVPVDEARSVTEALVGGSKRVEMTWGVTTDRLPKGAVKVLLNFAQIGLDALVRGGTLDIGGECRNGASEIVVRAGGRRIAFDLTIGRALENRLDASELSSRTAAAHMLALLAKQAGGGLQFMLSDDALVLGAVLPEG
jgi:histidine phosphotransferase ChpT